MIAWARAAHPHPPHKFCLGGGGDGGRAARGLGVWTTREGVGPENGRGPCHFHLRCRGVLLRVFRWRQADRHWRSGWACYVSDMACLSCISSSPPPRSSYDRPSTRSQLCVALVFPTSSSLRPVGLADHGAQEEFYPFRP